MLYTSLDFIKEPSQASDRLFNYLIYMSATQLILPLLQETPSSYREKLISILQQNLDFHDQSSRYSSHNFHSFPAKFPPQLPLKFILSLTQPGERVFDPMMGSGTTILEATLNGRRAVGSDIDPLAHMISEVKSTPLDKVQVLSSMKAILRKARITYSQNQSQIKDWLNQHFDPTSREFINYWFVPGTQAELITLLIEIEKIQDLPTKRFFLLAFSSIIITKSGGVSLALDLGHTRPHRAKIIYDKNGQVIAGQELLENLNLQKSHHTKRLRSAYEEFEKRVQSNLNGLMDRSNSQYPSGFIFGDAQNMPIANNSIDLIITSPPYASNAIDYMRAHKFSLVWLEHTIHDLGQKRNEYIGGEALQGLRYEELPDETSRIVNTISTVDKRKAFVLHRYYSEMTRVIKSMYRVLKPGKAAIVVVGSSIIRGQDTQTQDCLAEIGTKIGFEVPAIGVRRLDRDRRMLPVGNLANKESQIQQRMHEEYIIGFYKPPLL